VINAIQRTTILRKQGMDVKLEVEELMKAYLDVLSAHVEELEKLDRERTNFEAAFVLDLQNSFSGLSLISRKEVPQKRKGSNNPIQLPSDRKKRKRMIPPEAVRVMKDWLMAHKEHPYPSPEEKQHFVERTGLSLQQVDYWFINARRRILRPLLSSSLQT